MASDGKTLKDTLAKRERAARLKVLDQLFETRRPEGLSKRVYTSLKHAILTGSLAPGTKLPSEPVLAETFCVSRPTVRLALQELRDEGLTTSQRGSGNFVSDRAQLETSAHLSFEQKILIGRQVLDDLEFRLAFEPVAAALAAQRRTDEDLAKAEDAMQRFDEALSNGAVTHHFDYLFHEAIAVATKNERFIDAIQALEYRPGDRRIMVRDLLLFRPKLEERTVVQEHWEILELIRQRDSARVWDAMCSHIKRGRECLNSHIEALRSK